MALIKDGYWQDTYWASRYWQEDYWPEYGTYVPPTPPAPTGTRAGGAVTWERPLVEPLRREEQQAEEVVQQPLTLSQILELLSHLEPRVATVEDLRRVLAPFLEAKQVSEDVVEAKLRELLSSFKRTKGSTEESLRKLLHTYKTRRVLDKTVEERMRRLLQGYEYVDVSVEEEMRKIIQDCIENKEHN